jgi:hypothetical protein
LFGPGIGVIIERDETTGTNMPETISTAGA